MKHPVRKRKEKGCGEDFGVCPGPATAFKAVCCFFMTFSIQFWHFKLFGRGRGTGPCSWPSANVKLKKRRKFILKTP